jgi:hypothetical protein
MLAITDAQSDSSNSKMDTECLPVKVKCKGRGMYKNERPCDDGGDDDDDDSDWDDNWWEHP